MAASMARVSATPILFALALLPCGSIAATLTAEQHVEKESMIRRETGRLEISALGEIVQAGDLTKLGTDELTGKQEDGLDTSPYCDVDFPMGTAETNNCTDAAEHQLVTRPLACMEAASRSGATTVTGRFTVAGAPWAQTHPKGCYKDTCTEAANGVCYFFNNYGGWPGPAVTGTVVCQRPKLLNGTKDTNGGCPATYEVIDHEDVCREAANCWNYPQGAEFRIGEQNASKHLEYPRGCFIDHTVTPATVFFNPQSALGVGTNVKGVPICNVTSTVAW